MLQAENPGFTGLTLAEFNETCSTNGIGIAELAAWEGVSHRAARHWRAGARPIPSGLLLLVALIREQPWLLASVRRLASDQGAASGHGAPSSPAPHARAR